MTRVYMGTVIGLVVGFAVGLVEFVITRRRVRNK
jgi:uncharacterized membrane-anchored protein YhcB (DUF1043 family)